MPFRRDSDEDRLPEGMRRVGYDADTQRYTFVDEDGKYYEGPEGARYGVLRPVGGGGEERFWSREEEQRAGLLDEESGLGRGMVDSWKGKARRKFGVEEGGEVCLAVAIIWFGGGQS